MLLCTSRSYRCGMESFTSFSTVDDGVRCKVHQPIRTTRAVGKVPLVDWCLPLMYSQARLKKWTLSLNHSYGEASSDNNSEALLLFLSFALVLRHSDSETWSPSEYSMPSSASSRWHFGITRFLSGLNDCFSNMAGQAFGNVSLGPLDGILRGFGSNLAEYSTILHSRWTVF